MPEKNNIKRDDIVTITKIINKELLFLFPEKKKENKIILKKKYVLQPKLVGILQKIFETEDIKWNFESSLTENIIAIYKEKLIKSISEKIFMEISSRWTNLLNVLKNYDEYETLR